MNARGIPEPLFYPAKCSAVSHKPKTGSYPIKPLNLVAPIIIKHLFEFFVLNNTAILLANNRKQKAGGSVYRYYESYSKER